MQSEHPFDWPDRPMTRQTRRELVLARLLAADGRWVDGTEIASAHVGGSEGIRRLRELRAEGRLIEERRHPDPRLTRWQYRLLAGPGAEADDGEPTLGL